MLTAQKYNGTLGFIKRMASGLKEAIFHPPLAKPHLEYCAQVRAPSIRRTWPCSSEEPEEAQKDDWGLEHFPMILAERTGVHMEERRSQETLLWPSSTLGRPREKRWRDSFSESVVIGQGTMV